MVNKISSNNTSSARIDIRLSDTDKAALMRIAKKRYRTLSSLLQECIDNLIKEDAAPNDATAPIKDNTWRKVIRHFGGNDKLLCGPTHDELANP